MTDETPDAPPARPAHPARRTLVIAGVVGAVALVMAGVALSRMGGGGGDKAQAPPIELPRLGGEGTVSLASLRGKPVVVNFFASWCVPCRKELPAFQAVASRLGDRVAFLGIDHQDDQKGALQLLADTGVRFPAGYDPDGTIATRYGLFGMPSTVFISADGRVLDKHLGELSQSQLEEEISRLFGPL